MSFRLHICGYSLITRKLIMLKLFNFQKLECIKFYSWLFKNIVGMIIAQKVIHK